MSKRHRKDLGRCDSRVAKSIMCGEYEIGVAGGVESVSLIRNKYKNTYRNQSPAVVEKPPASVQKPEVLLTKENLMQRFVAELI